MRIGELAKKTSVKIETIRYYEKSGIIPAPPRNSSGYRTYDTEHLKRLSFIKKSRGLGFSIEKIKSLLGLVDEKNYTCNEINQITSLQLESVQEKIRDLKKLEKTLKRMTAKCGKGNSPYCPIIDDLYSG